MGCYFSKELSDLVLMYSEYQFGLTSVGHGIKLLKRYADDGILIFSSKRLDQVMKEIEKLMLFYPKNLVHTVYLNFYTCKYLDLSLNIDDYTAFFRKVHLKTYFKPLHKFAYLDPSSNNPRHVFKGLIRTECFRYKRNSSTVSDYLHSLDLFKLRLLKQGYSKGFIDRNMIDYYGTENEQKLF